VVRNEIQSVQEDTVQESILFDDVIPSTYRRVTTPVDRASPDSDTDTAQRSQHQHDDDNSTTTSYLTRTNSFQNEIEYHPQRTPLKRNVSHLDFDRIKQHLNSDTPQSKGAQTVEDGIDHLDSYEYSIADLPTINVIDFDVNLDEVSGMAFLVEGSNSLIFTATWKNQLIVVKVSNFSTPSSLPL
jgi:hypothetical protein